MIPESTDSYTVPSLFREDFKLLKCSILRTLRERKRRKLAILLRTCTNML